MKIGEYEEDEKVRPELRKEAMKQARRFAKEVDKMAPPTFEKENEKEELVAEELAMEEEEEELGEKEEIIITKGIVKAKEAFQNYLENVHGFDPAYWRLKIVVEGLDAGFEEVLERFTWEDLA